MNDFYWSNAFSEQLATAEPLQISGDLWENDMITRVSKRNWENGFMQLEKSFHVLVCCFNPPEKQQRTYEDFRIWSYMVLT